MPKAYEEMKRKFMKQGMSEKDAEGHSARIYNASRQAGQAPVTRGSDKRKK